MVVWGRNYSFYGVGWPALISACFLIFILSSVLIKAFSVASDWNPTQSSLRKKGTLLAHAIEIARTSGKAGRASCLHKDICIRFSLSSFCFPQCWLNFQASFLHMVGSTATLHSLIFIAGDPRRRQRLFLILLT